MGRNAPAEVAGNLGDRVEEASIATYGSVFLNGADSVTFLTCCDL